jgi:hypothetical protein
MSQGGWLVCFHARRRSVWLNFQFRSPTGVNGSFDDSVLVQMSVPFIKRKELSSVVHLS